MPERIFENMGMEMKIVSKTSEKAFKAIIQPLRYKNKIYLNGVPPELGYDSLKKYLLLSPADVDLSGIDGTEVSLYVSNTHLSIDHTETVYFGNVPFYNWSIVSKEE
jgi:hypothetical protein